MNQLLRKDTAWRWTKVHQKEFEDIKKIILLTKALTPFSPKLPTQLYVDTSRKGFGAVLIQVKDDKSHSLIACSSQALTPAQTRYSVTELEMTGVKWAVVKMN